MEWLYEEGDKKMSEIADYLRISRPSATALVKKLEELGYAKRYPDGEDKRSEFVSLTRKGQLVTAYQIAHRKGVIDEVAKEFTDEELKTIVKGFKRLSEVFENCCEVLEQGKPVSERKPIRKVK
jgi:DNA-binding MarR family transcriptional regulator